MPGLVPGIHVFFSGAAHTWMAGASPAMTRTAIDIVSHSSLNVAGVDLVADLSGALFWEEQSLLVVSDLHLEKGSSFATRGVLLPPYDTVATLGRLAAVIARHDPGMVIALGDSFHDRDAHGRLSAPDRDTIAGAAAPPPPQARRPPAAPRLDLDFGQSRSRAAVRSRRRGRS